jgi:hypothetical protein
MFFAILFCASVLAHTQPQTYSQQQLKEVAYAKPWLKLLHYKPRLLGGFKSQIDGEEFFFSKEGKHNPLAELKASLEQRKSDLKIGYYKQSPECAFPERYRYLRETFDIKDPAPKCEMFEKFLERFAGPKGVSLVFSSAFPNNPASMFGHTFLKIHSAQGTDLLDMGINYAAQVPEDESGLLFMVLGVGGGYRGQWSSAPYYTKVNEYANFESRDLWEYELNFSNAQTMRLLGHLWELETNSYQNYFFFDENCSYQILAAIEVVRPDLDLTAHTLYVAPAESVKNLARHPELIRKVTQRPSFHARLFSRYNELTSAERSDFFKLIEAQDPTPFRSRYLLDTAAAYYDYLRAEYKGRYKERYEAKRETLLKHRATLGPTNAEEMARIQPIEQQTRPDWGHDSFMWSVAGGHRSVGRQATQSFVSFKLRSSYHDLLNKDLGYKRYAHIEFPWLDIQWDDGLRKLRLEQLNLLSTTSLHPLSRLDQKLSFRFASGVRTFRDYGCLDCVHGYFDAGAGGSFSLGSDKNLLFVLFGGQFEPARTLPRGYRYGPNIELGVVANPWENYKLSFKARQQWDLEQSVRASSVLSVMADQSFAIQRNWEVRNTNLWQAPLHQPIGNFESRVELIHFFN